MTYRLIRIALAPLFRAAFAGIEGLPQVPAKGGFVIAANHIDFLDGFFLALTIVQRRDNFVRFLSKTNNYWWAGGATIPVNSKQPAKSLERARVFLERGGIIAIFPEGARNPAGRLLPGKTGAARLALWTGLPVLPVGMIGPSGTTMLESIRLFFRDGKRMNVQIGAPLAFPRTAPEQVTAALLEETTATIMQAIAALSKKTSLA